MDPPERNDSGGVQTVAGDTVPPHGGRDRAEQVFRVGLAVRDYLSVRQDHHRLGVRKKRASLKETEAPVLPIEWFALEMSAVSCEKWDFSTNLLVHITYRATVGKRLLTRLLVIEVWQDNQCLGAK